MKAELDDIIKGLDDSVVLEKLRAFPDLFRPLFVYDDKERLTAGNVYLQVQQDLLTRSVLCRKSDASSGNLCVFRKWVVRPR